MQHKESTQHLQNSITAPWGGEEKQQIWLQWKINTIEKTTELHLNNKSFQDLYSFVANERYQIAQQLDQENKSTLGALREAIDTTYITNFNRYRDFYPYLMSRFTKIPVKEATVPSWAFFAGDNKIKSVTKVDSVGVIYQDVNFGTAINYSSLSGVSAIDRDDRPIVYVKILHTACSHFEKSFEILEKLNKRLNEEILNENEKIEIIKEIVWHLAHSMFCKRGSAAITEIILSALCKAHHIDHEEWTLATPPDLIALFSTTSESFSKAFSLNPRNDMLRQLGELIDKGVPENIVKKLKSALEGEKVKFTQEEKVMFFNKSSYLNQWIKFYSKKGILVDKLVGFDLSLRTSRREAAAKPKFTSPPLNLNDDQGQSGWLARLFTVKSTATYHPNEKKKLVPKKK